MNSILPPGAIPLSPGPKMPLAWVEGSVPAGFPSQATDFAVKRHDLNERLITHPDATFMWTARGESMVEFGIFDGDLLICNRALNAEPGDIVIAELDDGFTVKQLWQAKGSMQLLAGNKTFPPIIFKDGQTMRVIAVVTATIKCFKQRQHVRAGGRK
jgi:DNA polymerase V